MAKVKYSKTLNEEDLQWKTTSNWRRPQKVEYLSKCWPDLPQIWNLSSGDQTKIKNKLERKLTTNGRMEEDLKILKVEYLSNHWPDSPQILNLSLGDQTKIKNAWNEDDHKIEGDLKVLKVEYLSNHWSDLPQTLNLRLGNWTKITHAWKEDDHHWKKTTKY